MKPIFALALGLCASSVAFGQAATIAVGTPLNIFENQKVVVVQTAQGPVEITRTMTACGKNGGTLQPLVPVPGVHPIGEIEIIQALSERKGLVVDMRDTNDRVKGTIPGSVGIPYTEVVDRMTELGCSKTGKAWNCTEAKPIYAFCNGAALGWAKLTQLSLPWRWRVMRARDSSTPKIWLTRPLLSCKWPTKSTCLTRPPSACWMVCRMVACCLSGMGAVLRPACRLRRLASSRS